MKKVLFSILLLFFALDSWGSCTQGNYLGGTRTTTNCFNGSTLPACGFANDGTCFTTGYYNDVCLCSSLDPLTACPSSNYNGGYLSYPISIDGMGGCLSLSGSSCYYGVKCTSKIEADSLACELEGNSWEYINNVWQCVENAPCDSTHWECTTDVETSQTTIASDKVECFDGDCFGGVYCEYISKSTTDCRNDCGQFTTQSTQVPIRYEGHCNEDNLLDDTECTKTKCMTFDGFYKLFKLCASREIINGERRFLPRFVGGGKGSCRNAGWPESDSTSFSTSPDSVSVSEDCFTMGLGCPPKDSTDYNEPDNRNPNKCTCEPFDGISYISRIVCPDGSVSVFYGSCDDFRNPPSSSSSDAPESSSSGSENPPASSGALVGDWVNYSQGEEIKGILGIIASKLDKEQTINNVNSVNIALDDYTVNPSDSVAPLVVPDSMLSYTSVIDTEGIVDAVFGRVTEENEILDTLSGYSGTCPTCTFFGGGASIVGGRVSIPEIRFDFSNFWGFNLCAIISRIVIALASIVAFFIGFAIFKNISQ